jgi:hypothetical protein
MKKLLLLVCLSMGLLSMVQAQDTPPQDSVLQQYTGKYSFPEGSVIREAKVTIENGALIMTSSAGASALEKQSEDLYNVVQFRGTAKFNRDANRKVIGVSVDAMGYRLEGTKVEDGSALRFRLRVKPNGDVYW